MNIRQSIKYRGAWGTVKKGLKATGRAIGVCLLAVLSVVDLALTVFRFLWWCVWAVCVIGVIWLWTTEPNILQGMFEWARETFFAVSGS